MLTVVVNAVVAEVAVHFVCYPPGPIVTTIVGKDNNDNKNNNKQAEH